jgi:hypothetical protein
MPRIMDALDPAVRAVPAWLGLATVLLALLCAIPARAGQPLSCNDPIEGHWPYGPGYVVESWSGTGENLVLVGNGAVLSIIDASNPGALSVIGEVSVSDPVRSIAVSDDGNLVAVSDWRSMIHLVDISNRAAPQARGSKLIASNRQPYGVDIVGNRLYVAIRNAGVGVFDISDPGNLNLLGTLVTPGTAFVFDLKVRGSYAYLADDAEGVTVVDISNAASPMIVGGYAGSTLASRLVIDGSRAYVARRGSGFDILDLSIPTAPSLIGTYDTPAIVYGVVPLGTDRLAVADGYEGTYVFDISNPAAPVPLGSDSENVYGLASLGDIAYTLPDLDRRPRLRALEFSTPMSPSELDTVGFFDLSAEVRVAGDKVLVANRQSGLSILGMSDPVHPLWLGGYLAGTEDVTDVEWVNGHAIVGSYGQLDIVDISNPASAQLVSTISESNLLLDLDHEGNRLFVTWGFSGMKIYDLANPAMPMPLGTFLIPSDGAIRVAVQGNLAIVSDQSNRVHVVDISNPASPQQLGEFQMASFVTDLDLEGSEAHVATQLQGVRIYDISTPASPMEISNIPMAPAVANALAVRGDRSYAVAGEYGGLRTYNISNPAMPMFIDEQQTSGEALWVDIENDVLAVSDGPVGVRTWTCVNDTIFRSGFDPAP